MKFIHVVFVVLIVNIPCLAKSAVVAGASENLTEMESVRVLKGMIAAIKPAAGLMIVKSWRAADTVKVNEKTSVSAGTGESIDLNGLRIGDMVTVYYVQKDGKKTALKIRENTPPPVVPAADTNAVE